MVYKIFEKLFPNTTEKLAELIISLIAQILDRLARGEKGSFSGSVLYVRAITPNRTQNTISLKERGGACELVKGELEDFIRAVGKRRCWVDFRGGDSFLILKHNGSVDKTYHTLISVFLFGIQLQRKAKERSVKLGLMLDWENNAEWVCLKERPFVIGPALDDAQFLTSFADREHFFLSERAHLELKPLLEDATRDLDQLLEPMRSNIKKYFDKVWPSPLNDNHCYFKKFPIHDQQKRTHELYNFFLEGPNNSVLVGSKYIPHYRVAVEYRRRIDEPEQEFIKRLEKADEVSIIGLTHETTAKYLNRALEFRRQKAIGFWKQLTVVFPTRSVLSEIEEEDRSLDERLKNWEHGKKSVFMFLLSQGAECLTRWECREYHGHLPFIGNRFVGEAGASIRVAMILPGANMKEIYYMEMFEGSKAYDQLSDAFIAVCNRSTRIIEWDIYGRKSNGSFCVHGLINRKRLQKIRNYCFPVVLVILHAEEMGGRKVFLQERTFYNAASDIGTFSNISGRLIDRDVYTAMSIKPPDEFEDISDAVATTEFYRNTGLSKGLQLPKEVWEMAAIRELKEEIGLEISRDRLEHCSLCCFGGEDCSRCTQNDRLFFNIYSLELNRTADSDEIQEVKASRPHSNLWPFDMTTLQDYHREGKFNRLLQGQFESVFCHIFHDIGISQR